MNTLLQRIVSYFTPSLPRDAHARGYSYAQSFLKEGGDPMYLGQMLGEAELFNDYTDFDRGVSDGMNDWYKEQK